MNKISSAGLQFLGQLEGNVLKVYKDSAGYPTAGEGHLVLPQDHLKVGDVITKEQADKFLLNDVSGAENAVNSSVKIVLNQDQFDACVCLAFNIGGHAFCNSTLVAKINGHEPFDVLAQYWLEWDHAGGKIDAGLEHRRHLELKLYGL